LAVRSYKRTSEDLQKSVSDVLYGKTKYKKTEKAVTTERAELMRENEKKDDNKNVTINITINNTK
jgi:hypothetical protein